MENAGKDITGGRRGKIHNRSQARESRAPKPYAGKTENPARPTAAKKGGEPVRRREYVTPNAGKYVTGAKRSLNT